MNEIMKIVAVMFLYREMEHSRKNEYWGAAAYANAFDLLCYALKENGDCVSLFDGYEQAKKFIEEHPTLEFWELEDCIKGW